MIAISASFFFLYAIISKIKGHKAQGMSCDMPKSATKRHICQLIQTLQLCIAAGMVNNFHIEIGINTGLSENAAICGLQDLRQFERKHTHMLQPSISHWRELG